MAAGKNKQARRLAVLALAISAFTLPAVAQADPEDGGRGGWRARSEEGGRQPRSEGQDNGGGWRGRQAPQQQEQVREAPAPQAAPQAQAQWQGRGDRGNRGGSEGGGRSWNGGQPAAPQAAPVPQPAQQAGWEGRNRDGRGWNDGNRDQAGRQQSDQTRTWNGGNRPAPEQGRTWTRDGNRDQQQPRNWTDAGRQDRDGDRRQREGNWNRDRSNGGYVQGGNYYGTSQGQNRDQRDWNHRDRDHDGDRDGHRWDRQWRDNSHYNWFSYRSSHPSYYRLGSYYAPYRNYSYRRLSIGFYLDSLFFSQNYWIEDTQNYRLPDVYGPYRWVRYYDDAVLVDIYTGEVVDVINNFFW